MKRNEALEFIRNHSRLVRSVHLNPVPKHEIDEYYDANYMEQRLSDKGVPFVINDYGKHGWDIYFLASGNNVEKTIGDFKKICLLESAAMNNEL